MTWRSIVASAAASLAIVLAITATMSILVQDIEVPIAGVEMKPANLLFYYGLVGLPVAFVGCTILSAMLAPRVFRMSALKSLVATVVAGGVTCAMSVPFLLSSGSGYTTGLVGVGALAGVIGGAAFWVTARLTGLPANIGALERSAIDP